MRVYYFARAFQELGANVSVLSGSYSHKYYQLPDVRGPVQYENIDGIRYCWIRTTSYRGAGLGRLMNNLQFALRLRHMAKELDLPSPDALIASSPPPFLVPACRRIARRLGARFYFEVRDLWPLTLIAMGRISRWHPLSLLLGYCERLGYRSATAVISSLPNALEYTRPRGCDSERFEYIPNGVHVALTRQSSEEIPSEVSQQLSAFSNRFVVGYVGAHTPANSLSVLLQAATMLKSDRSIGFVLVGDGSAKRNLMKVAAEKDLRNILLLDAIPRTQVQAMLQRFDCCYVGLLELPELYQYGVSMNKMFEYMLAAKPVIASLSSPGNPIEVSGGGVIVPPETAAPLAEAIQQLALAPSDQRAAMGRRGREYVVREHDIGLLAKRYLKLLSG